MKFYKLIGFGIIALGGLISTSCSNEELHFEETNDSVNIKTEISENQKENLLVSFAEILSKATFHNKELRDFLKKEAVQQFDKNYDVLYYLTKDKKVSKEKTFREMLISHSSENLIDEIEFNVPLLNILIPKIAFFNINPEELDIEDNEIPVAVSKMKNTSLYLNGKEELSLAKGEIPNFHVFVVNENSRVIAPNPQTAKSSQPKSIIFKSPNFDGSLAKKKQMTNKEFVIGIHPGQKALEAFKYFYADDGGINQKALQRDYIYYGITPTKSTGSLNRSVSEYISFIEINPRAFFKIADQSESELRNNDPVIREYETSQTKRELTHYELLDRLWTKGAYDFKFEIITSTTQRPQVVYIPLRPDEIWDFNLEHHYRNPTMFRRSKHTYRIDPNKFTAKRVILNPNDISFDKWNIAEESIYRYVIISEEDESTEKTTLWEYETTRVHSDKFNGDLKIGAGINKVNINAGVQVEVSNSNTIREKKSINLVRKEKSDELGEVRIYFYDPVIDKKASFRLFTSYDYTTYTPRSYNTGIVKFAISAR